MPSPGNRANKLLLESDMPVCVGWRGGSVKGGNNSRGSIGHGDVLVVYGPLITKLMEEADATFLVWFADDATGVGTQVNLTQWWSSISTIVPLFGYHSSAAKRCLVVRDEQEEAAKNF